MTYIEGLFCWIQTRSNVSSISEFDGKDTLFNGNCSCTFGVLNVFYRRQKLTKFSSWNERCAQFLIWKWNGHKFYPLFSMALNSTVANLLLAFFGWELKKKQQIKARLAIGQPETKIYRRQSNKLSFPPGSTKSCPASKHTPGLSLLFIICRSINKKWKRNRSREKT